MRYFTNLEFLPDRTELGPGLQSRRQLWTASMYVLLSLGIFARQLTSFNPVTIGLKNANWSTLIASFVIGLALLPPAIRWVNGKKRDPSWEQVVTGFSIGFFVDLTSHNVVRKLWHILAN